MGFVLFIHILVCILLVITILMQAGKGGGLAESFASAESMFGTQTNAFMVRTSTILAAIFLLTSLTLAIQGAKADKSLMSNSKMLPKVQTNALVEGQPEVSIKIEAPKPMDLPGAGEQAPPIVNAAP